MATAKKLPSGSWRCLVYSHTETVTKPDGTKKEKRIYKSFTCDDPSSKGKRLCEAEASAWAADKTNYSKCNYTFKQAYELYISSKENILSPSTIRGYTRMEKYYEPIMEVKLSGITQQIITEWVNGFAKTHSPKTVRNAHGLLTAILREYAPEVSLHTSLPQKIQPTYVLPSDEDIKKLLAYLSDIDMDLLRAVYLAAFGTLRRSEVCGLTADDVKGANIHVHKVMVKDKDGNFVIKTTKTVTSDRFIELPQFVIDSFPNKGRIVNLDPDAISRRFRRTLKVLGIPHFRFHDLRHYAASIMHALGVPDQYIMQKGGWKSDTTLKAIYRGAIDDYAKKYNNIANEHFNNMQHEMQHEKEKSL